MSEMLRSGALMLLAMPLVSGCAADTNTSADDSQITPTLEQCLEGVANGCEAIFASWERGFEDALNVSSASVEPSNIISQYRNSALTGAPARSGFSEFLSECLTEEEFAVSADQLERSYRHYQRHVDATCGSIVASEDEPLPEEFCEARGSAQFDERCAGLKDEETVASEPAE